MAFINKDKAFDYLNTIQDPIVRELVARAYGILAFEVAPVDVDGDFDLHVFFVVMERFMRDREALASELRGETSIEENGQGKIDSSNRKGTQHVAIRRPQGAGIE